MMRASFSVFVFLSLLGAFGCGGSSFVALDVSADCGGELCAIPDSVDGLLVRTFDATDLDSPILEESISLSDQSFPVLILLEPGDATPERLTQEVQVQLDGTTLASGAVEHGWESGKTNRVQIIVEVP